MSKFGLMRKNGVSFLLALSFLLLLTTSFIGCSRTETEIAPTPAFSAATTADFKTAVDNALAAATNKRGTSVAVYKNGYSMWTYAAGLSDGTYGTATGTGMTSSTPTYAYSITKTFVSALVLTQIENGLYTLDNTVDSLLGSNADYLALSVGQQALINKNATVRQLLTHTSGMWDYAANLNGLIPMCDPAYTTWKPADILEKIVYLPLGTIGAYKYSNTNYVLLGMIAQEMSVGKLPLNTLLANTFFSRLGITAILAPQDAYPLDIARPYDDAFIFGLGYPLGSFTDFSTAIKLLNPTNNYYLGVGRGTWAAGGIIATAPELAKWGYQLYDTNGRAVTPSVKATLKNSATLNNDYGYGVNYNDFTYTDGTVGGTYGHGGSAPGWKTSLRYEKIKGITVVIITNVNNSATGAGLIDQDALAHVLLNAYKE